ncbi:MAG: DUF4340 domain-containing protein [Bacteroidota bacterium]
MNNKTLLLIFAALVLLYLGSQLMGGKKERSFDPEIVNIDTTVVDRIVFHPKADEFKEVRLEKGAEGWMISKETVTVPAQGSAVSAMLSELRNIRASRIAAKSEEKWGEYEVDAATGNRVQVYKGAEVLADLVIGRFAFNPQARSGTSYLRLNDQPDVYAVDGFLSAGLSRGFNSFRDASLVKFNKDDITSLQFLGMESFNLNKGPDNQWLADGNPVDSAKVANFLNNIQNVNGSNFSDGVVASALGDPVQSLSISGNNMTAPIKVDCYAVSGQQQPFLLHSTLNDAYFTSDSTGLFTRLFKPLVDFQ